LFRKISASANQNENIHDFENRFGKVSKTMRVKYLQKNHYSIKLFIHIIIVIEPFIYHIIKGHKVSGGRKRSFEVNGGRYSDLMRSIEVVGSQWDRKRSTKVV